MAINNGQGPSGWPGRDRDPEVNVWRQREIKRLWREGCEGSGLCEWRPTPNGLAIFIPLIGRVTLGTPTVMTVELRPGQLPEDIELAAPRIAHTMEITGLRVTPLRGMWVRVELLAVAGPDHHETPSAPPSRQPVPPVRRTQPSRAWTSRWHAPRFRRPEQPS
jgi:hypothetical protein